MLLEPEESGVALEHRDALRVTDGDLVTEGHTEAVGDREPLREEDAVLEELGGDDGVADTDELLVGGSP